MHHGPTSQKPIDIPNAHELQGYLKVPYNGSYPLVNSEVSCLRITVENSVLKSDGVHENCVERPLKSLMNLRLTKKEQCLCLVDIRCASRGKTMDENLTWNPTPILLYYSKIRLFWEPYILDTNASLTNQESINIHKQGWQITTHDLQVVPTMRYFSKSRTKMNTT